MEYEREIKVRKIVSLQVGGRRIEPVSPPVLASRVVFNDITTGQRYVQENVLLFELEDGDGCAVRMADVQVFDYNVTPDPEP